MQKNIFYFWKNYKIPEVPSSAMYHHVPTLLPLQWCFLENNKNVNLCCILSVNVDANVFTKKNYPLPMGNANFSVVKLYLKKKFIKIMFI